MLKQKLYTHANTHWLTAARWTWITITAAIDSLHPTVLKDNLGGTTGHMAFLSPNQQCQSTERNSKH